MAMGVAPKCDLILRLPRAIVLEFLKLKLPRL